MSNKYNVGSLIMTTHSHRIGIVVKLEPRRHQPNRTGMTVYWFPFKGKAGFLHTGQAETWANIELVLK